MGPGALAACLLPLLLAPGLKGHPAQEAAGEDAATAQDTGTAAQDTAPITLESIDARLDSLMSRVDELSSIEGILTRLAGEDPAVDEGLEDTADRARAWGLATLVAIVFLAFAWLLVRATSWLLDLLAERNAARRLLYKRLVPIARVLIWVVFVIIILRGVFGFQADTLLAAGAAVGVAIGFAAQDILKNIFGGLVIIGDRPFQVGDKVRVGESYGEVKSIGLRSTRIVTPDDSEVSVPNAQIVGGQVANANSGNLDCQVVTDLYLPGWVDIRAAKDIAYRAAVSSRYVFLAKPVVVIATDEVHMQFLTHLKVKAYVQDIRHEFLFMSDVTERARAAFVEAGLLPPWHGATALKDIDRAAQTGSGEAGTGAAPARGP